MRYNLFKTMNCEECRYTTPHKLYKITIYANSYANCEVVIFYERDYICLECGMFKVHDKDNLAANAYQIDYALIDKDNNGILHYLYNKEQEVKNNDK